MLKMPWLCPGSLGLAILTAQEATRTDIGTTMIETRALQRTASLDNEAENRRRAPVTRMESTGVGRWNGLMS